jgi:hypothetical protein
MNLKNWKQVEAKKVLDILIKNSIEKINQLYRYIRYDLNKSSKFNFIKWAVINLTLIALFFYFIHKFLISFNSNSSNIENLNNELKIVKTKNGTLAYQISQMQSQNIKDILDLKSKDDEIKRLQKYVKENKSKIKENGSVTVATGEFVISNRMTEKNDSLIFNDEWIKLNVTTKPDPKFDLKVITKPVIILGEENGVPFALYKDENPYLSINDLKSYGVKPKKSFFEKIHVGVGYAITGSTNGISNGLSLGIYYELK